MLKLNIKLIIFLCSVFFVTLVSAALTEEFQFGGNLTCSQIGPRHPEYTEACGKVYFHYDEAKQELSYELHVEKLKDAYMAHLHIGPCGDDGELRQGPVAAWLYPDRGSGEPVHRIKGEFTGVLAKGVIKPEDLENDIEFSELIKAMRDGNAYANVHTKKYITGEICGRINAQK